MPIGHYDYAEAFPANADGQTVRWFVEFCITYFRETPVQKIFLLGSRATGIRVREKSDHDFFVVISDNASEDMSFGRPAWTEFYNRMNAARVREGIPRGVDAFVLRQTDFDTTAAVQDTPAQKALALDCVVSRLRDN